MQVVLIVFMAVVMCVTIVTLAMMVSDMVKDRKGGKAKPVQFVVRSEETEEEPEMMEIDPEVAATLSDGNAVVFAAAKHEFPLPDGGGSRKRLFLIHRRDDRIFNQVFQAKPSQVV